MEKVDTERVFRVRYHILAGDFIWTGHSLDIVNDTQQMVCATA